MKKAPKHIISCSCGAETPVTKENYIKRDKFIEDFYMKKYGKRILAFLANCDCKSTNYIIIKRDETISGNSGIKTKNDTERQMEKA